MHTEIALCIVVKTSTSISLLTFREWRTLRFQGGFRLLDLLFCLCGICRRSNINNGRIQLILLKRSVISFIKGVAQSCHTE